MKKVFVKFYDGKVITYEMKNKSDHMQYFHKYKKNADTITLQYYPAKNNELIVLKR